MKILTPKQERYQQFSKVTLNLWSAIGAAQEVYDEVLDKAIKQFPDRPDMPEDFYDGNEEFEAAEYNVRSLEALIERLEMFHAEVEDWPLK